MPHYLESIDVSFAPGECSRGCGRIATTQIIDVDANGIEIKYPMCKTCFNEVVC